MLVKSRSTKRSKYSKMRRWDIIQRLIEFYNYKKYLEIGIWDINANYEKIRCPYKVCVDPNPQLGQVTFKGTSDEYFNQLRKDFKYDIIFVDGLHIHEQVETDIYNSFKHLNKGGSIVVHDTLPHHEPMQSREDNGTLWTGDVWKAIAKIRMNDETIKVDTVDTDFGCTILQKEKSKLFPTKVNVEDFDFNFFEKNRNELLNVITTQKFLEKYS